jgi:predicted nucleic acid-binding protein
MRSRSVTTSSMQVALDTNILIAAHLPKLSEHGRARQSIERHLLKESNQLILTTMVLHEFIHVITDARRFENPPSMDEAIHVTRGYCGQSNVTIYSSDVFDFEEAMNLISKHHLSRNRIADTLLAATLKRHGVDTLWTRNKTDFAVFDFLNIIDPTHI